MLARALVSRAVLIHTLKNAAGNIKQAKRNAGHGTWSYRVPPPLPSKRSIFLAEGIGALCWWWIFWHILTESEHITGEFPYKEPRTYTDAELGIPPLSAGSLRT